MSILQDSIAILPNIGKEKADVLRKELNIVRCEDLINLYPYRYIDRTKYYKISEIATINTEIQIIGKLGPFRFIKQKKGQRMVASFSDNAGSVELVWFRGHKELTNILQPGKDYVLFGKKTTFNGSINFAHPELELLESSKASIRKNIQPVYPSTERLAKKKIDNRLIARCIEYIFQSMGASFYETLPKYLCDKLNLLNKKEALLNIHFPRNQDILKRSIDRIKFEEFFYIQLQLWLKNIGKKENITGLYFEKVGQYFNDFYNRHLPFELTNAQKRVLKEIRKDLKNGYQMNRLLQGDVGSGKTIVAFMTMLMAIGCNYQACIVAPTEILAMQHYEGMLLFTEQLVLNIELLTGSTTNSQRKVILENLKSGHTNILVGTHAIFEDRVKLNNLGIAIIDEQHRFGVAQRAKLWSKNNIPPHILIMSATPIPRTLAMSIYGDLDISTIDELPPNRKPIKTLHKYENARLQLFYFMKEEIKKGRQIYVVYPLIEESETLDYNYLVDGVEALDREFPKPTYQMSVLHGKMKSKDKEFEINRFQKGETHIMVATTVIEVGVNIPNASVMIIESAERFGLSQLHQLRGRVGRGTEQSYCILMTGVKLTNEAKTRMKAMVDTNDGFKIAEVDMKLRGPGDLTGTQQSGVLKLKIANLSEDQDLLKLARYYVQKIIAEDTTLSMPKNMPIKQTYQLIVNNKSIWKYIG